MKLYGSNLSNRKGFVVQCPGEELCERLNGTAGETLQERFEEASPGCPRNCQTVAGLNSDVSTDEDLSQEEIDLAFGQIEEMVDAAVAGEQLLPEDFEWWEWESFIFWRKTERSFERAIKVKIGWLVDSFFK